MLSADLNRQRKLGCEYEFSIPIVGQGESHGAQQTIAQVLSANGLPAIARGYSHYPITPPYVLAVENDSSVMGENRYHGVSYAPIELKTKILSGINDWEAIVPKALEICSYLGGRAVQTAGHHVHMSFPEAQEKPSVIRSLYNLMHRFEPVIIDGLLAPSRRQNGYCRRLEDRSRLLHRCHSLDSYRRALANWDRRYGLNMTHIWEQNPHLEFRYHQATLNPDKARHWVRFCLQLVQHAVTRSCQAAAEQVPSTRQGLEKLLITCGFKSNSGIYNKVSAELRETGRYLLLDRFRKFGPTPEISPNSAEDL